MSASLLCPLCLDASPKTSFAHLNRTFFECSVCDLFFVDPKYHLPSEAEKKRYESHQNDVLDPAYQNFVMPLFHIIQSRINRQSLGLDFGAGTGPVLTKLLTDDHFTIDVYDPYFHPHLSLLTNRYDFIFATEVVEHFYFPRKDFNLMTSLLRSKGYLFFMTLLHQSQTEKETWFYLKDPTHVCAYSQTTFEWIKRHYGFSQVEIISPRMVVLSK